MTPQSLAGGAAPGQAGERSRSRFASDAEVPWCNGCSYTQLNEKIQAVLGGLYKPLDVVLVSDIGCIGIVDKLYACHTVHGLHGRSVTLAAGLRMVHEHPDLKVLVFIGDGGCSIGLQGLIEAARLNADVTVLAFDNQNYGMTGGQHSTFTLPEVKTVTTPQGSGIPAMDLVRMLGGFPGVFRARLTANDARVPQALEQAFLHKGFAYVETLNFCSSYVGRMNADLALSRAQRYCESFGREFGIFPGEDRPPYAFRPVPVDPASAARTIVERKFAHRLQRPVRIVLGGSAGSGVQTAATLFLRAAALSGLHGSLKSDYPVTVGKGHSTCEIILSPEPILYAGIAQPDLAVLCTADGQRALASFIPKADKVVYDSSLALAAGRAVDLRTHGARNAAFFAFVLLVQEYGWMPLDALRTVVAEQPNEHIRKAYLAILAAAAAP